MDTSIETLMRQYTQTPNPKPQTPNPKPQTPKGKKRGKFFKLKQIS